MQAHGAARGGVGTPMPRVGGRLGGLPAVAAVLVVVAVMALMTRGMVAPVDTGGWRHRTPRRASWARP